MASLHNLNPILVGLKESVTLALNAQAKELQRKGVDVINLTAGELEEITPLFIQKVVKSKLRENRYAPPLGFEQLRSRIAGYISKEYAWDATSSEVAVTAGAKQALFEAFQVIVRKKDEVIIPTPSWVSYEHQVRLAGGVPVFCPLDPTFDLDVEAICKRISPKTRAIILNSPHNPTGAIFSTARLTELGRVVSHLPIYWIVDDIYRTLVFDSHYISPARYISEKKYLVLVNGFSKSHALTGWRIGYMVADPDIIRAVGIYQSHTSGNAALSSQYAAQAALDNVAFTADVLRSLRKKRDFAARLLKTIPNISFVIPKGAFYFFINIGAIEKDAAVFCEAFLKEAHVALIPGNAFHGPGHVRLSFTGSNADLGEGVKRLKKFIVSYRT
ncbi:aminotransferase class I/II-fold pyridoxal phosphate-dependent enzyme [Candidatus Uhrbacteria bacterium]|nr:aminotransferase class I/II-fold pyridoxal phosphate-dependent enzyme [Candidatus Uhrbacteria bacterium]